MKNYPLILLLAFLLGCNGDSENSNLELINFIKPEYSTNQISLNCNLASGKTLNSVERFIPKFINSFSTIEDSSAELFFLFPVLKEDQIDTNSFRIVFNHSDDLLLDKFKFTLKTLSFDQIANCNNSETTSKVLKITNQNILSSNVISEILNCEYINGFNYATLKLVLEQFTDALLKNNLLIDILYAAKDDSNSQFEWTNIFLSTESREEFVKSWQSLEVSKEIQELLLEQSICQSSKIYRTYKVI